jgi:hypothetical protein
MMGLKEANLGAYRPSNGDKASKDELFIRLFYPHDLQQQGGGNEIK